MPSEPPLSPDEVAAYLDQAGAKENTAAYETEQGKTTVYLSAPE